MAVVIWGKEIASFGSSLALLLAERGVAVTNLTGPYDEGRNPRYPDPFRLRVLERRIRAVSTLVRGTQARASNCATRLVSNLTTRTADGVRRFAGLLTVIWIGRTFDALILSWASSVSGARADLFILRAMKCRIIVVLHGSEARAPYLDGFLFPSNQRVDVERLRISVETRARRLKRVEEYADYIVGGPGVAHFLSKPIIDRERIGFPILVGKEGVGRPIARTGTHVPKVIHRPSRATAKGTNELAEILDELADEGINFEVDWCTEWRDHSEVLDALANSDVLIDQLYADLPGGVLAREAVALGCIAVVGSCSASILNEMYANAGSFGAVVVKPSEVKDAVRRILIDREHREELQKRGQEIMQSSQSPDSIAERWLSLLAGKPMPDWFFCPLSVSDVIHGFANESHLRRITRQLIDTFGIASLNLQHNRQLEACVRSFAFSETSDGL